MPFPEDVDFVCVIGWDPSSYQEALSWVKEGRNVAFIVEEERESNDPRIQFYHLESPLQRRLIAKKIGWAAVLRQLFVMGESSFKKEIEQCHLAAHLLLSDAADYWVRAIQNARANRGEYRRGVELEGAFQNIPALIVGAGPSLEKNGHLIREFQEKGLIFAGGSALNVIQVEPHFASSIDPSAPFEQFKKSSFLKSPFCYQARMNVKNFSLIEGEKLLFPDSSCEAINWMYEEMLPFDGGWTVGTFLISVAALMGCSPIILVGMDFCYEKGQKYAHLETGFDSNISQPKDWIMAARWIEEAAKKYHLINATEGGALSIERKELSSLVKELKEQKGLRKKVDEAIQALRLVKTDRLKTWDESFAEYLLGKEEGIVYEKLLLPLWRIWEPVFKQEIGGDLKMHQMLFFQKVLEEHGSLAL